MIDELAQPQDESLEETVALETQLQLLEKAIPSLKDEQRQCIELFYLEQKSYTEISEHLSIPLNTVKSAIQNGKRNLKIWMERQASHEV
jgi:RNA polymerase sigma-70 factor (ECF subfamily)